MALVEWVKVKKSGDGTTIDLIDTLDGTTYTPNAAFADEPSILEKTPVIGDFNVSFAVEFKVSIDLGDEVFFNILFVF